MFGKCQLFERAAIAVYFGLAEVGVCVQVATRKTLESGE
jgi:hypothetical protein